VVPLWASSGTARPACHLQQIKTKQSRQPEQQATAVIQVLLLS
jgi:hypothetical protein